MPRLFSQWTCATCGETFKELVATILDGTHHRDEVHDHGTHYDGHPFECFFCEKKRKLREHLLKISRAQVRQYPQFNDEFWGRYSRVVKMKRAVRTKMGLAFAAGDMVLMDVTSPHTDSLGTEWVDLWSIRNKITTTVRRKDCLED